jgi:hypothetical protein
MRAIGLLLALASLPAAAQPVAVVAIGRDAELDRLAAEAETRVRLALRYHDRDVVNVATPNLTTKAAVEAARVQLLAGEAAYSELDAKLAERSLSDGLQALTAEMDRGGDRELQLRGLALLGSVRNQTGQVERAKEAFAALIALDPSAKLDAEEFPPDDVKLFNELQEEAAFTAPASLQISSDGLPAAVFIDGRYRGVTPLTLDDLEPGRHGFLVRRQGYAPRSGEVDVGGSTRRLKAPLVPPEGRERWLELLLALEVDAFSLHPTLLALAEDIGNPETVAMVVERHEDKGPLLHLVRSRPAEGVLLAYRELPLGEGWQDALVAAITEIYTGPDIVALAPEPEAPAVEEEPVDLGPVLLWSGVAVGTAVLLAAAGAGVAAAVVYGPELLPPPAPAAPAAAQGPDPHEAARRRVVLGF